MASGEIDLVHALSDGIHRGSITVWRGGNEELGCCYISVNSSKNVFTLDSMGTTNGTTFTDKLTSDRTNKYYVYRVEGIY